MLAKSDNHCFANPLPSGSKVEVVWKDRYPHRLPFRNSIGLSATNGMSPVPKIIELMYFVEEPPLAVAWYSRFFQVPAGIADDPEWLFLPVGAVAIWFHRADSKVAQGAAGQVAYWEVPDFDLMLDRAISQGAILYRGPLDRGDGKFMCQVKDPFGNLIGLVGPRRGKS
jgi:predicted enzyme related to lactoylglutathione lyase